MILLTKLSSGQFRRKALGYSPGPKIPYNISTKLYPKFISSHYRNIDDTYSISKAAQSSRSMYSVDKLRQKWFLMEVFANLSTLSLFVLLQISIFFPYLVTSHDGKSQLMLHAHFVNKMFALLLYEHVKWH